METQVTTRSEPQASHEFSKRLLMLTVAGGSAFWTFDFVISVSPIAAEYKAAFSISSLPVALAEALVGGLVIALCISFFLLRFFDSIPGKKTIFKALILSFFIMVIIEVFSALGNPAHASVYLLLDTEMNAPRFLALGFMTLLQILGFQKMRGLSSHLGGEFGVSLTFGRQFDVIFYNFVPLSQRELGKLTFLQLSHLLLAIYLISKKERFENESNYLP